MAGLEARGLRTARVAWSNPDFDWSRARAAVFRSTWDYFDRFAEFSAWMERVAAAIPFFNSPQLVRWNVDKHYLRDLAERGVNVPVTQFIERAETTTLREVIAAQGWNEAILKPAVSGAARHTYRFNVANLDAHEPVLRELLRDPWTRKVAWDPIRDTTPVLQLSGVTFGIVVPAASPFKSLDDLFAHAKAHPDALSIATNGAGTTPHVVIDELFGKRGLRYIHVPYKGTSEQMIAVAAGQVMVGVNSNGFAPFVDSGQLRLLVTFGEQRTRRWPTVPTLKELGHNIVAISPYGLAGPAGMPADVVQVLHLAFKAAMADPAFVAELARYDQEPAYLGPEDYARALRAGFEAERLVVERLGLAQRGE